VQNSLSIIQAVVTDNFEHVAVPLQVLTSQQ